MRFQRFLAVPAEDKESILRFSVPDLAIQPRFAAVPEIDNPKSAAQRWATYVLRACKATEDPRTLAIWARQAAVSYTTLCESCRLIEVRPRRARDFVRVLRLVTRPSFEPGQLASFLDISDRRTLESIVELAGFGDYPVISPRLSVLVFLDNQRFIKSENEGLKVIREVFLAA